MTTTNGAPTDSSGPRRFCRFSDRPNEGEGRFGLPPDGLCLSVFLLIAPADRPGSVVMGRLDPAAPWAQIGALDPERVQSNARGWMLPASHLVQLEAPDAAAARVAREQLGVADFRFDPPTIFSEVYPSRHHPGHGIHWDLGYFYRARWPSGRAPEHPAWKRLEFIDPARTRRSEFARSHDEVLEAAGYSIA
jgi:ADP-ribose pyrophosphatase YjhB (NUDIX family)